MNQWSWLQTLGIKSIFDVGAHVGEFAKKARGAFPDAHIYSFEPQVGSFNILKEWAATQKNITLFNTALGDIDGEKEMFQYPENRSGSATFFPPSPWCRKHRPYMQTDKKVPVQMRTLDSISKDVGKVQPEILVKLDVEGYELDVIQHGREFLKDVIVCLVEVQLLSIFDLQYTFQELVSEFCCQGFWYAGNFDQLYSEKEGIYMVDSIFTRCHP